MTTDTLILERFNGREVYAIREANLYVREGRVLLRLESDSRLQDTTGEKGTDHLTADIWLSVARFDPAGFVGSQHRVAKGEVGRDLVARLYYFDHLPIDENEVRVLERTDDGYRFSWTGSVEDPNFYDGSKRRTRLTVDATFALQNS